MKTLISTALAATLIASTAMAEGTDSNVIDGLNIVDPDTTCGPTEDIWDVLINGFGATLNVMTKEGGLAVFDVAVTGKRYVVVGNAENACLIASY